MELHALSKVMDLHGKGRLCFFGSCEAAEVQHLTTTYKNDKPLETLHYHVHLYRECTRMRTRELVNSLKMKDCSQL